MRTERSPVQGDPAGGRWPRATEEPGSPLLEGPAPCRGHCGPTRLALRWIWVQRYLARSRVETRCVTSLQLAPEPAVQTGSCSAPGPGARPAPASSRSAVAPFLLPHGVALGAESDCASHERHSR